MAQAELHEVFPVDRDKLMDVILKYEDYPKFVTGCRGIKVDREASPGKVRVTYDVSMMKDIIYTVDISEDPASGKIRWTLVHSEFMKKNEGFWEIKIAGPGKTDVRYGLEVEFNFPVPGLILNKLVKGSLPSMVKSFVDRAKK